VLLAACVLFGILAADPQPGFPDGSSGASTVAVSSKILQVRPGPEVVLYNLINQERGKSGLKALHWDAKLAEAAEDHAKLMSERGGLSHQFSGEPDLLARLTHRSVRLDTASENVVYDSSAEAAHEAFDKSLPHRENMLNATFDGVGIAVVNRNGILYVVEDFAHRISDMDNDAAEQAIADHLATLRQQHGLPPLEFIVNPRVQLLVEQMAARGIPDGHGPLSLGSVRSAASYATTSPDEIPPDVARLAALSGAGTYTVGVRFVRTAKYPSGLFWVSIVLFDENSTLARR